MMKSLYSITFMTLLFSAKGFSQDALFWNQYSAGNPAATGVNSALNVSSITSLPYRNTIYERVNAEVRIKKMHGALGGGYDPYYRKSNYYTAMSNGAYLNYSFHWKTGENSLLAFGVSGRYASSNFLYLNSQYKAHSESFSAGLGIHYQYKNLKIGVAGRTYDDSYLHRTRLVLSDIYIDHTLHLGENWALNSALHLGDSWNGGSSLMSRAIYKNKFWFGASYDMRKNVGILAGINLNDKWSIGYSISAGNSNNHGFKLANQSLSVRFQLPQK